MKHYYQDDAVTIYHGDCREILPELPKVDLVLTDPPYNIGIFIDEKDHIKWIEEWFFLCREIARTVVIITGQKWCANYALVEKWKWLLMWHKPAAMGRSPVGFCNCAPIPMWGEHDTKTLSTDVITAPIIVDKDEKHPTPKPLKLMLGLLGCFGSSNLILDPFMGSGTTLRAAKDLNRKAIGIEIEEKYCEIAARRMQQEVLDFEPQAKQEEE